MSDQKQRLILAQARLNGGKITKKEAIEVPGVDTYYHNAEKHVGEILSRMVKKNLLIRIKPGHFEMRFKPVDPNQTKLF
jgi:predicted transcriptional regulator of viral defense system